MSKIEFSDVHEIDCERGLGVEVVTSFGIRDSPSSGGRLRGLERFDFALYGHKAPASIRPGTVEFDGALWVH